MANNKQEGFSHAGYSEVAGWVEIISLSEGSDVSHEDTVESNELSSSWRVLGSFGMPLLPVVAGFM